MAGGIFGLLGGYLTDLFGRRSVLTWSILLYAVSAFAAGFSTSVGWLLFWRCCTFVGVCVEFVAAVAWLLELFPNPKQREAMESGRLAFRLKGARAGEPPRSSGGERIEKGLLTERAVIAAAKAGKRLVVGRRVVLTPLARDKARQLGVEIERE